MKIKTNFFNLSLLAFAAMLLGASPANAALTLQNAWAQQYAAIAYPSGAVNASYAIANGNNRLLVVTVAATRTAIGTITCSATYGGVPMTLAAGDGTSSTTWNHSFIFYLKDADIGSASGGKSLNVTVSGGTAYYNYVAAAVYAGVDQTTPLTDAKNHTGATPTADVGPVNLSINANDQAVGIVNLARSATGTTVRTVSTWATGWTTAGLSSPQRNVADPCFQAYVRERAVPTSSITDTSVHTADSANTWDSYTAISINAAPVNTTTVGTATATVASQTSIAVTMPYSNDDNANNTYTVEYKFSSGSTWTTWVANAAHTTSPYATTITGLTPGASYDVRVTYNDADGVTGTNPQTITPVTTTANGVTELSAWDGLLQFTATTAQTVTYNVPSGSGSQRVLVVAIGSARTSVGSRTVTLTYGGQALALVNGDMSSTTPQQHTALYYLNEAGLDAATSTTLSVTVSGGTTRITDVFAAVYDNVNQTTPVADSKTYTSGASTTTTFVLGTGLAVNAGNKAVEIICSDNAGSTTVRTVSTYPANWSNAGVDQTSAATDGIRDLVTTRAVPTSNVAADTTSTTMSSSSLGSMTAMSLGKGKATPAVIWPTATGITYGQALSASTLSAGEASVAGTFAFTTPSTIPNAGTYVASVTFTPTDTVNYTTVTSTVNVTVNPKALSVTAPTVTKIYNGTTAAGTVTVGTLSGFVGTETVTATGTGTAYASKDVGSSYANTVSYALANGINGGLALNYSLANSVIANAAITPKALSITAPTVTKVYSGNTTAGTVTVGTLSGFVGTETVTATGTGTAYASKDVGSAYANTVSYALANGINGGLAINYSLANSGIANAAITPKALSITAPTVTKVYDGGTTAGTVTVGTLSGFVGTETVTATGTGTAYSSQNVGSSYANTVSYALANGINGGLAINYSLASSAIANAAITAKALTIGAPTVTKIYDGGTTAGTATPGSLSGFVGTETVIASVNTVGTYSSANVGSAYSVTVSYNLANGANGGLAANYSLASSAIANAAITAKALTIGAPTVTKIYDGGTTAGTATLGSLSGFVGTETVIASVNTVGTYSSANVGSAYSVTVSYNLANGANGGLAANYSLASSAIANAAITAKALTIGAPTVTKIYDGGMTAGTATLGSLSGFVGTETVIASVNTVGTYSSANVGSAYSVTVSYNLANGANGGLAANYSLASSAIANAAIMAKALTIGAPTVTKIYDGGTTAGTATLGSLSGFVGTETVIASVNTVGTYSSANVGSAYSVTVSYNLANGANGGLAANYSLASSAIANAAITAKAVTLSGARAYNGTATAAAAILTIGNNLDGANLTLSGVASLASANVGLRPISAGSLALGGSAAGNYTLTGLSGSVDITALAVTLSGTRTYDGTATAAAAILTIGNNFDGGNLTLSGVANLASANAGPQAISAGSLALGGSAAGNYTLTGLSGTLQVLPALTIANASHLSGFLGIATGNSIEMTLVVKDSGDLVIASNVVTVATSGSSFSTTVGVPANAATISIQPHLYLRKKLNVPAAISTDNEVTLTITTDFLGGDVDNNNQVDGTDYAWLRACWSQTGPLIPNDINNDALYDARDFPDLNGDGVIDPLDYAILTGGWYNLGDEE